MLGTLKDVLHINDSYTFIRCFVILDGIEQELNEMEVSRIGFFTFKSLC
jgi:hypothetical protein